MRAGQLIGGRYRLDRQVGAGSFAEVWAARHVTTGTRVALKIARPPVLPAAAARLEREARAVLRVRHPSVVQLVDRVEGEHALAFELVDGVPLSELLEEDARLAPDVALAMTAAILGALAATHAAGVVHRDVSPSNILHDRTQGTWSLVDYGVARIAGANDDPPEDALTTADTALGSIVHQAPEQIEDARQVDGARIAVAQNGGGVLGVEEAVVAVTVLGR